MRHHHLALIATGAFLIAADIPATAGPFPLTGLSRIDGLAPFELVAQRKSETLKQKVKRVWRDLTGYKFAVACPAFPITLSTSTCTETGKNRDAARAKCQSRHAFCRVSDAR
jgi:hypothetical protein